MPEIFKEEQDLVEPEVQHKSQFIQMGDPYAEKIQEAIDAAHIYSNEFFDGPVQGTGSRPRSSNVPYMRPISFVEAHYGKFIYDVHTAFPTRWSAIIQMYHEDWRAKDILLYLVNTTNHKNIKWDLANILLDDAKIQSYLGHGWEGIAAKKRGTK